MKNVWLKWRTCDLDGKLDINDKVWCRWRSGDVDHEFDRDDRLVMWSNSSGYRWRTCDIDERVVLQIQNFISMNELYSRYRTSYRWTSCTVDTELDMGWLWLVGSIKIQVSFAKEPCKRDNILQKKPIILSILLTVATPYRWWIFDIDGQLVI